MKNRCPLCGSKKETPPYYAHEVVWSCSSCFFRCHNDDLPRIAVAMECQVRHNALREAVVSFFKVDDEILSVNLREAPDSWKEEIAPRWKAARAEVGRLLSE